MLVQIIHHLLYFSIILSNIVQNTNHEKSYSQRNNPTTGE